MKRKVISFWFVITGIFLLFFSGLKFTGFVVGNFAPFLNKFLILGLGSFLLIAGFLISLTSRDYIDLSEINSIRDQLIDKLKYCESKKRGGDIGIETAKKIWMNHYEGLFNSIYRHGRSAEDLWKDLSFHTEFGEDPILNNQKSDSINRPEMYIG